jgi:hypothetical protein
MARLAALAGVCWGFALAGTAAAHHPDRSPLDNKADVSVNPIDVTDVGPLSERLLGGQHGGSPGHLPAKRENVELVGKLELTGHFGNVLPEQIADLAVFGDAAYLNSWADPACTRGGVYVADIRRPSAPREIGFIPALSGNYHGEGAHVISAKTKFFKGDLLAVNNEFCTDEPTVGAGFDLYDVTNPQHPKVLVQGFGDRGPEGSLTGTDPLANQYHSVFLWQDGKSVYLVGVDNEEFTDVDIYDVSNPRSPQPVAEFDLLEEFPQIEDNLALGNLVLHHDMVVKRINGVQTMLSSYWDAGYVKLDVSNPAAPTYIGDTSFDGPDPLTGLTPPEGNAHQAEFSADNRFILAADEDFNPYRAGEFRITTGPNAGLYPSAEVPGGVSVASLPDRKLNGPVVYGGYGCDASAPIPPRSGAGLTLGPGEEAIVVLQRGPAGDPGAPEEACFPGEKAANGIEAGYDAVLLVNRHLGSEAADSPFCGSGGYPPGAQIVTLCTTHAAFHRIFDTTPVFSGPSLGQPGEPAIGQVGQKVEGTAVFDGWGYGHVYENGTGKLRHVGAFAIEEALDPRFAFGFGDLSIHEFATAPRGNLAFSAYYAGGARVFRFGPGGLEEVGAFIDKGGNNFWGVEVLPDKHGRDNMFATSDRDFGLYIFRYSGRDRHGHH